MIDGVLPDPRRHVYRADLAAESLRDRVKAARYVAGAPHQVNAPVLPLKREPRFDAQLDSEVLLGETVTVFDEHEGWAWVQASRDSHVGYMPSEGLVREIVAPTHRVVALRTYIYPSPDIKSPPLALLSLNALVAAVGEEEKFLALQNGGFVFANHTRRIGEWAPDYVAVAECFLGTPYLWGGRTSVGLDCSGLVQLAAEAAGLACPRDTDMQAAELGRAVDWQAQELLMRGDLVFWEGHVGIMTSERTMLHANAHHMATEIEALTEARARLSALGLEITGVRRLPPR